MPLLRENLPGMRIEDLTKIPAGEHWAILEIETVHIPGDERSRTAPGHGYPAHTERYISYDAFTNCSDFEAELIRRHDDDPGKPIRGIHVASTLRAKTTTVTEVTSAAGEPKT